MSIRKSHVAATTRSSASSSASTKEMDERFASPEPTWECLSTSGSTSNTTARTETAASSSDDELSAAESSGESELSAASEYSPTAGKRRRSSRVRVPPARFSPVIPTKKPKYAPPPPPPPTKPSKSTRTSRQSTSSVPAPTSSASSSQDEIWPCDTCDKKFATKQRCQTHIRAVHTGSRPYSCSTCGERYTRPDTASRHIREATNRAAQKKGDNRAVHGAVHGPNSKVIRHYDEE
ncbi:hypothetical protein EXIGLDRAFT_779714 [Exidia glandulosa HHB12029]|uniref:C2H2-type domain-containing protein n=1 Tax=Exidia glandulosa HHB12029 TaxID=1314781 RepID=A0A165BXJ8_EXIGL|nr:hypothetical protein EXIGLDRAFT_779714 [Exidia glandulosa HHB12029]